MGGRRGKFWDGGWIKTPPIPPLTPLPVQVAHPQGEQLCLFDREGAEQLLLQHRGRILHWQITPMGGS